MYPLYKHKSILFLHLCSGLLKTAWPLDRETTDIYYLEAHVQDANMPEWECVSLVEIRVLDSNDNPPMWSQTSFSSSLTEDTPTGKYTYTCNS